jgi:hypothetical protein
LPPFEVPFLTVTVFVLELSEFNELLNSESESPGNASCNVGQLKSILKPVSFAPVTAFVFWICVVDDSTMSAVTPNFALVWLNRITYCCNVSCDG